MTQIIGKIKNEYKNILQQADNVVNDLNVDNIETLSFSAGHKLDEDQWYYIENFSQEEYYINPCDNDFSTASLNQIENQDYLRISSICIIQGTQRHFQRITPSLFVHHKTFLNYSGAPKVVQHRKQIEIKEESDAVYISTTDSLYFKSVGKLKLIFPGIEELYREATQTEVDDFVDNDFIFLDGITNESIGPMNRKRIADIGAKYERLEDDKKRLLIEYAKEQAGVDLQGDSFSIKSETDLKNVLYAMDQRYYYADIYEENRVANSIRVLTNS